MKKTKQKFAMGVAKKSKIDLAECSSAEKATMLSEYPPAKSGVQDKKGKLKKKC